MWWGKVCVFQLKVERKPKSLLGKCHMKMNDEKYRDLMLRFAKELNDVGVSDNSKKIIEAQYTRTPNVAGCSNEEVVRKFHYRHNGYMIEAVQTVKLTIKKCT